MYAIIVLLASLLFQEITVSWDEVIQNSDGTPITDLQGYRIYYGTVPGNYDVVVDVRNEISHRIGGFVVGITYFFAVTAYDFSGNESEFSEEVSFTPIGDFRKYRPAYIRFVGSRPTEIPSPGALQISNLSRYSEFLFTTGASAYSDRVYLINDAADLEGAQGIRTTNDDKFETAAEWVIFDVSEAADVIICYDVRLPPPSWLTSSFSRAGFNILVDKCGELEAWTSRVPAGRVQLGANKSPTIESCMYLVAVRGVP